MKILVINGPNLNLLGTREPDVYGNLTLDEIIHTLKKTSGDVEISHFQSNVEGELIDELQQADFRYNTVTLCIPNSNQTCDYYEGDI